MGIVNTKIGDVFSVKTAKNRKKYFQNVVSDLTQLNSDVIRAFNTVYQIDDNPDLSDIISDEVQFYAHCVTKLGLKMRLWEKVGNVKNVGNTAQILFRGTSDYGVWVGDEPIKVSEKWYVWRVNEPFMDVGKLLGEKRNAEIGVIVNPHDIVERIITGKYSFFYPEFE